MPKIRSRVAASPAASNTSGGTSIDEAERAAINARLEARRRQRREARLRRPNNSNSGSMTHPMNNGEPKFTHRNNLRRRRNYVLAFLLGIAVLTISWVGGTLYLVLKQHTHGSDASSGKSSSSHHLLSKMIPGSSKRAGTSNTNIHPHPPSNKDVAGSVILHPAANEPIIDMRQMSHNLPFDNPNGGAWTQGWDVQPAMASTDNPIKIFVVPHSHCDPGWIKTFDEYFQTQTKNILSSVVASLAKDPRRKFIWAEISYFEWWWKEQTSTTQDLVRTLLKNKQFEFVTGGWVQPDEANTQLYAMEIQLQEGHKFLRETFGEWVIPKYGWSIDPFGYSPTMAYLLKKYNFQAMLIQRVHYAVKKELALHQNLEFLWRQTWDDSGEWDMFTHVMPFYSYDVPHTCGPDPSVCCQFDFARVRGMRVAQSCPWHKDAVAITDHNLKERSLLLLDQYLKKSKLYRSNVVIAPLGDDFRYQTVREADFQYENYEKIFDYINANVPGVEIQFGLLSDYFQATMGTFDPPVLKGSFFTYSDREQDYWSGYFTSRIFDKALDRKLERTLYAATSLGGTEEELQKPRRDLSLFQHHDGVTGTAKDHVVRDYAKRIHDSIRFTQDFILKKSQAKAAELGLTNTLQACWQSDSPRGLAENLCDPASPILVYNALETPQQCGSVTVPPRSFAKATLPCEVPGAAKSSTSMFQFDPHTGLMTHPIEEKWMIWKVRQGGAYLFFPGTLQSYMDPKIEIKDGGFEVTGHNVVIQHNGVEQSNHGWKRTLIQKEVPTEFGDTATVLDFEYVTDLQQPNEEWFVRFTSDIHNEKVFHTDLNGYNFDTHYFRDDMPIQSQVFPMPTLASIEDEHTRLTVLSEHAQGTASLENGSIDVWLDRRLRQDDARGLGQGVLDNVPTRTRLRVVLEHDGYDPKAPEFEITPLVKQMWKELNHPLEMFGTVHKDPSAPVTGGDPQAGDAKVSQNIVPVARGKSSSLSTEEQKKKSVADLYMPVVYMTYNRVDYLKRAISSLRASDFPRERVPIIISHDGHIQEMVDYVKTIQDDFNVVEVFHPHACFDHPDSFPGEDPKLNEGYRGDTYGNPREGKVTCCKHHFTWLMNEVFTMNAVDRATSFMFLEEDYIVAPTIYSTAALGTQLYSERGGANGDYFGITLDPTEGYSEAVVKTGSATWKTKNFVTGPMILDRAMFAKIKASAHEFCTFDDYNWDWSLVHLMGKKRIPEKVFVPSIPQVAHIGLEGMHGQSINDKKVTMMRYWATNLGPFEPTGVRESTPRHRKPHLKGYGGWGHPADQEHCMKLFQNSNESQNHSWREALGIA